MIDLRTIYLTHVLISIVSLFVTFLLWKQSRNRFRGLGMISLGILFQVVALLLIFLRSFIPDFLSIPFSNTLALAGTLVQMIGLKRFTNQNGSFYIINWFLLGVFFVVANYFTFALPSLQMRNTAVATLLLIYCLQISHFLIIKSSKELQNVTIHVGMAFLLYGILNAGRLIYYASINNSSNDYFNSGLFEVIIALMNQLLYVYLTYALVLMVNKRLIVDLTVEEEKFSKAFHLAPYAVLLTNPTDGKIMDVNEKFFEYSGYSNDEIQGETTLSLGIWNDKTDREKVLLELKTGGIIEGEEWIFNRKNGELMYGVLSSVIINLNHKKLILSTIVDITERKQLEEKLMALNASKDKFFSILAHDLVSPFNSILGLSEVLMDQQLQNDITSILKVANLIHQSSEKAVNLVKNLLEWSRSQTGRLEVNQVCFKPEELIREAAQLYSASLIRKEVALKLELTQNLFVFADKEMISTIIRNLLSNAIKFSHRKGEIVIKLTKVNDSALCQLVDYGIGIKSENIGKLFKIEADFSLKGTENEGGTGLGLVLCKEFIEKNQGSIFVESVYGRGSIFSFTLPLT